MMSAQVWSKRARSARPEYWGWDSSYTATRIESYVGHHIDENLQLDVIDFIVRDILREAFPGTTWGSP